MSRSVYFPPEAREEVAAAYLAALEQHWQDGPFYAAGDFNLQLLQPRDTEEIVLADRLHHAWQRRGVKAAPQPGPTRRNPRRVGRNQRGGQEEATLDGLIAPEGEAWAWAT